MSEATDRLDRDHQLPWHFPERENSLIAAKN
jgi:hypothetical protein